MSKNHVKNEFFSGIKSRLFFQSMTRPGIRIEYDNMIMDHSVETHAEPIELGDRKSGNAK